MRIPFGATPTPAPTSPSWAACSKTVTSTFPMCVRAIAVDKPPIPPPTTATRSALLIDDPTPSLDGCVPMRRTGTTHTDDLDRRRYLDGGRDVNIVDDSCL